MQISVDNAIFLWYNIKDCEIKYNMRRKENEEDHNLSSGRGYAA